MIILATVYAQVYARVYEYRNTDVFKFRRWNGRAFCLNVCIAGGNQPFCKFFSHVLLEISVFVWFVVRLLLDLSVVPLFHYVQVACSFVCCCSPKEQQASFNPKGSLSHLQSRSSTQGDRSKTDNSSWFPVAGSEPPVIGHFLRWVMRKSSDKDVRPHPSPDSTPAHQQQEGDKGT